MKKKLLSTLLALCMVLALLPTAFAVELKSDMFTYILSNDPVDTIEFTDTENVFDDDGTNIIGERDVIHTVYVVPDGTVVTNPDSTCLLSVVVILLEEEGIYAMSATDSFTVEPDPESPRIYCIQSFVNLWGAGIAGGEDEGIYVIAASDAGAVPSKPETPDEPH